MDSDANVTITVLLKNGDVYRHMDTTDSPFGDESTMVAFWLPSG